MNSWFKHEGITLSSATFLNLPSSNSISELRNPKDRVRLSVTPFVHLLLGGSLLFRLDLLFLVFDLIRLCVDTVYNSR